MLLSEMTIKEGDYLVRGGIEYAVRSVDAFDNSSITPSFRRAMRLDATIERRQVQILSVTIAPIDPASVDAYSTNVMQAPIKLYETFVAADDGYIRLRVEAIKR